MIWDSLRSLVTDTKRLLETQLVLHLRYCPARVEYLVLSSSAVTTASNAVGDFLVSPSSAQMWLLSWQGRRKSSSCSV